MRKLSRRIDMTKEMETTQFSLGIVISRKGKRTEERYVNKFMIEEMTNHKRLDHKNQTIYLQSFDIRILKEKETYEKEKKVNNGIN